MVCLGFEPRVHGLKAQTNPLSYKFDISLCWISYTNDALMMMPVPRIEKSNPYKWHLDDVDEGSC